MRTHKANASAARILPCQLRPFTLTFNPLFCSFDTTATRIYNHPLRAHGPASLAYSATHRIGEQNCGSSLSNPQNCPQLRTHPHFAASACSPPIWLPFRSAADTALCFVIPQLSRFRTLLCHAANQIPHSLSFRSAAEESASGPASSFCELNHTTISCRHVSLNKSHLPCFRPHRTGAPPASGAPSLRGIRQASPCSLRIRLQPFVARVRNSIKMTVIAVYLI